MKASRNPCGSCRHKTPPFRNWMDVVKKQGEYKPVESALVQIEPKKQVQLKRICKPKPKRKYVSKREVETTLGRIR